MLPVIEHLLGPLFQHIESNFFSICDFFMNGKLQHPVLRTRSFPSTVTFHDSLSFFLSFENDAQDLELACKKVE